MNRNGNLDALVDALYDIAQAALCDQFGDERRADECLCSARERLDSIPPLNDALWVSTLVAAPA